MIGFEVTVDVDRHIDEVFAFVVDFENMPRWNSFVRRVERLTGGPITVGTRFHQVRETDEQDYAITRLERPHLVEIATSGFTPALVMRFELQRVGAVTRLTDTWTLETQYPRPLELLGTRRIRSGVTENLEKLKQLLELGAVHLQDGRMSHEMTISRRAVTEDAD